jgi:hypothetical protein
MTAFNMTGFLGPGGGKSAVESLDASESTTK